MAASSNPPNDKHQQLLAALMSSGKLDMNSPLLSDDEESRPLLRASSVTPGPSYSGIRRNEPDDQGYVIAEHQSFKAGFSKSMDNPIDYALRLCQEKVIKPYQRMLLFLGWYPVFSDVTSNWQKVLNVAYPILVVMLILLGYVISYASCFQRDHVITSEQGESLLGSQNNTGLPPCQQYIISQFLIPDFLHSLAYAYSFFTLRILGTEPLETLMERVFLMSAPTTTGVRSQGRLIKKLRLLLYSGLIWLLISQLAQIMHIGSQYNQISFYWLDPGSEFGRIMLLILMSISFIFLDIVYAATVINYCVQCYLILFFINCLKEKIREKSISLIDAMKDVSRVQGHVRVINHHPGIALSIVLINFGTMTALGSLAIIYATGYGFDAWRLIGTGLSVLLWGAIMLVSIICGAIMTNGLESLKRIGHEIRVRPFVYQDTSNEELDSFMMYMSSLDVVAKIFLIPVYWSRIIALTLLISLTILFLFQTGVIHIWL